MNSIIIAATSTPPQDRPASDAKLRPLDVLPAQIAIWGGAALAFLGLANLTGAFGKAQTLANPDPVFGMGLHDLMLVTGILQLAVASLLLFTKQRLLGFGLAAWISANFLVYRAGLWSMGWHHASGFRVDSLGWSLKTTDLLTSGIAAFMLAGSLIALWCARLEARAPKAVKISCPACDGHLEFPDHAMGRKIPCPHCQAELTLSKPI